MNIEEFIGLWHNDLSYVESHTSGSTGTPKIIRLPKADMCVSAEATNRFFGLDECSVYLCPLSPDYIAARMMAVRADIADGKLVMIMPSNEFEYVGKADLLAIVPSQVPHLLKSYLPDTFANIIIGGAALPTAMRRALAEGGFNAYESYGMTETCSHVALRHVADEAFTAMPDISFEQDERGCLIINAPRYSFGRLATNDIVKLIDNRHFVWLGRADNVINSGGIKIHPEQLEKQLTDYIPAPFYVEAVEDHKWGQVAGLVIEGDFQPDLEIVKQIVGSKAAPRQYRNVEALPRTYNGKIKR